jgi:hypothetical protein
VAERRVDPARGDFDDATVAAVHEVEQAVEWMEKAWGHLLACHHDVGHSQITMLGAADKLDSAGHAEWARRLRETVAVEDALPGRWTYQMVDEFRERLLASARRFEEEIRHELVGGLRHRFEARQKAEQQPGGSTSVVVRRSD